MLNRSSYLVVLFILLPVSLFAQKKILGIEKENFFRLGFKAGANVNKISGKSYKEGYNFNYQVGAFLQFNVTKRFGIQPEISLVQGASQFSNDPNDIYDDIFLDGSQKKAKLSFIEVPVLLNVNIGPTKRVKLQVGPSYSVLIKQTVDSLVQGGTVYKNGDFGAIGGLWIQLPLVNFGARYKIGFSNLNAIDDRQTWKSQAIQLFIGITF